MEISHDGKTDANSDNTGKLNLIIGVDSTSHIIGNLAIKSGYGGAGSGNNETEYYPTKIKIPIHSLIITDVLDFFKQIG